MKAQDKTHQEIQMTLSQRSQQQRGAIFQDLDCSKIIITANDDSGVIRNGGRRGAALGAKCIVHAYKKFIQGQKALDPVQLVNVCRQSEEQDFVKMQTNQQEKIQSLLGQKERNHIVHLGGGHDHIFPFLAALYLHSNNKKIHVINIDAHLDTRNDQHPHSGTPFRQFQNLAKDNAKITQIGIQDFANAGSNWDGMNMTVHLQNKIESDTKGFSTFDQNYIDELLAIKSDEITLFSIDLDAIASAEMPAVSAINPAGLSLMFVRALLRRYCEKMVENKQQTLLGLYEYNPIYDNTSGAAAKTVAALALLALN